MTRFDTILLTNRRRMRDREEYDSHQAWYISRYSQQCSNCGKQTHLYNDAVNWFNIGCGEGYDSIDFTECWKCALKANFRGIKYQCQRTVQIVKDTIAIWDRITLPWYSKERLSKSYMVAKSMNRSIW